MKRRRIISNHSFIVNILLCVFISSLCSNLSIAQNSSLTFQHLSFESGLTQDNINCINQDKDGYIWVSIYGGIKKFDGHTFKKLHYFSKDSIPVEYITPTCMFKDHLNRMWMGSGNSIYMYDSRTDSLISFGNEKAFRKVIGSVDITCINEDQSGKIWFGTRKGLYGYEEKNNEFICYLHDTLDVKLESYFKNRITTLLPDKKGNIWVGTLFGLYKFSATTHQFISVFNTVYTPDYFNDRVVAEAFDKKGNLWISSFELGIKVLDTATSEFTILNTKTTNGKLNSNQIQQLLCDEDGNMWIGHETKGINIYHPSTKQFDSFRHDESDPQTLIDDRISALFMDRFGMVWIGTQTEGIDRVSRIQSKFNSYTSHSGMSGTLSEKGITTACQDKNGNLWIGSQSGLMYFDRNRNTFKSFHHDDNNPNTISNDYIKGICVNNDGSIWIGTKKGLNVYNTFTDKWKHYFHNEKDSGSIPNETIDALLLLSNGEIWIGTDNTVCRYHAVGDYFENRNNSENIAKLGHEFYVNIFEDSRKNIWLATSRSGLYYVDTAFNVLHRYIADTAKQNGMESNIVCDFAEDKDGNIWMATSYGLHKLDIKTQKFTVYTAADGLSSSMITQIKIADDGKIWIASNGGLSEIYFDDKGKIICKNFNITDGIQSNLFYTSASFKLHSEDILLRLLLMNRRFAEGHQRRYTSETEHQDFYLLIGQRFQFHFLRAN